MRRIVFAYEGNVRPLRCESVPGVELFLYAGVALVLFVSVEMWMVICCYTFVAGRIVNMRMLFGENPKDKSQGRMEDTWFDMHLFKEKAKSRIDFLREEQSRPCEP